MKKKEPDLLGRVLKESLFIFGRLSLFCLLFFFFELLLSVVRNALDKLS